MSKQTIYYWSKSTWTEDKETADLAVEFLDFPIPEEIELPENADIQTEINKLVSLAS